MQLTIRSKKGRAAGRGRPRKGKIPRASMHGQGIAVSVDERVEDLARRFPALQSSLGSLLSEGRKRIRDFPPSEQGRLLRMVFALKKVSGGQTWK